MVRSNFSLIFLKTNLLLKAERTNMYINRGTLVVEATRSNSNFLLRTSKKKNRQIFMQFCHDPILTSINHPL